MFVALDVDFELPPLPLPDDWSSKIAVPGMSSVTSPRAIAGRPIAADTATTQRSSRLPNDLDMCPSPRVDCVRSALGARGPETYANCEGICHDKFAHTSTANLRKSLVIAESVDGLSEKKRTTGFEPATLSLGS